MARRSLLISRGRGDGRVIAGLYCAGLAMANPIGTKGVGAGTTIGPCLTFGYIAGKSITQANDYEVAAVPALA